MDESAQQCGHAHWLVISMSWETSGCPLPCLLGARFPCLPGVCLPHLSTTLLRGHSRLPFHGLCRTGHRFDRPHNDPFSEGQCVAFTICVAMVRRRPWHPLLQDPIMAPGMLVVAPKRGWTTRLILYLGKKDARSSSLKLLTG